jgi:hypothetical protein
MKSRTEPFALSVTRGDIDLKIMQGQTNEDFTPLRQPYLPQLKPCGGHLLLFYLTPSSIPLSFMIIS